MVDPRMTSMGLPYPLKEGAVESQPLWGAAQRLTSKLGGGLSGWPISYSQGVSDVLLALCLIGNKNESGVLHMMQ